MDSKTDTSFIIHREDNISMGVDGKAIEIQLREVEYVENIYGLKEYYVFFIFDRHIYSPIRKTTSLSLANNAYDFIVKNPDTILNETHYLFLNAIEARKNESNVKSEQ